MKDFGKQGKETFRCRMSENGSKGKCWTEDDGLWRTIKAQGDDNFERDQVRMRR